MGESNVTEEDIQGFYSVLDYYTVFDAIDEIEKENFTELPFNYLKYILTIFASDYTGVIEEYGEIPQKSTFSSLQELLGRDEYVRKLDTFLGVFTIRLAEEVAKGIEMKEPSKYRQFNKLFHVISHALLRSEGWEDGFARKLNDSVDRFAEVLLDATKDANDETRQEVQKILHRVYALHYDNDIDRY